MRSLLLAVVFALQTAPGLSVPTDVVLRSMLRSGSSTRQLLGNTGFENVSYGRAVGWAPYEGGYSLSAGAGRRNSTAVLCDNPDGTARLGAMQTLVLNRKSSRPLIVTGWSRAEGVAGTPSSNYSIYVDIIYTDGTPLWGQTGNFSTGTHGWERRTFTIVPSKPVAKLYVYALFRGIKGRVWFDDVEIRELAAGSGDVLYDGVPVRPVLTKTSARAHLTARTADGLAVGMDASTGSVVSVRLDGLEVGARGWPAGFFIRDVAADSDFLAFSDGGAQSIGLQLSASVRGRGNCIDVSGSVKDTTGRDRAVTLYFSLPVDLTGGLWWNNIRTSTPIAVGREYSGVVQVGTGANGAMSLYPFCCAVKGAVALSIGIDMRSPAQYRLAYNADVKSLFIAYDFALIRDSKRNPGRAPFHFVLFRSDPQWGFRSAAAQFYTAFPEHFACRTPKQGIWMPFTDISTVQGWKDFGFMFHEGNNNVPFDDSAGILSFRYTEPMTYWMPMAKPVPRTYEGALQVLREGLASTDPNRRRCAQAVLSSGTFDENGRYNLELQNTPWTDGAVFVLNPNPNLPGEHTKASLSWNSEIADALYGPSAKGVLDGEYLDSLEGWGMYRNFRREHFAYAQVPLTYTTDSRRPCILQIFSTYEFAARIADDIHSRGKLMFANAVPWRFPFLAALLDVMGTETNWFVGDRWQAESDEIFCLRRTACYKKPYLLLMNTNYDRMTPEYVEDYFRRCLFYGVYPSMFSHNASENRYWENPAWYNRDRKLFRRYIPLITRIASAGWEPVTGFASGDRRVFLERFGPAADGRVYLTAMNTSPAQVTTRVRVFPQKLGGTPAQPVENLLGVGHLAVDAGDLLLTIGPGQIAAFALPLSK